MKFTEFKNPQLTEEQIVLAYCKGEITKEDAVSHLSEMKVNLNEFDWRKGAESMGLTGKYGFDTRAEQDAQDAAAAASLRITAKKANAAQGTGATAGVDNFTSMPGTAPTAGVDNFVDMPGTGPTAGVDNFVDMPKAPKAAPKAKVKATAANTSDYDKTVALQKKLGVTADGLMGPNTRAAMKAAGMSAKKPVAKKKLSGPDRLSKLADNPRVGLKVGNKVEPLAKLARGNMDADSEFADPNAMTRRTKKPAPKKKMPRAFGMKSMPRVDNPAGGSKAAFGGKTLPKKDYDAAFGDN